MTATNPNARNQGVMVAGKNFQFKLSEVVPKLQITENLKKKS